MSNQKPIDINDLAIEVRNNSKLLMRHTKLLGIIIIATLPDWARIILGV